MKQYRALLSVPVQANSDAEAMQIAETYANSLADASGAITGHVELVGEVREGQVEMVRVVSAESWLLRQLPADWRP
jgi:hypothetical protein